MKKMVCLLCSTVLFALFSVCSSTGPCTVAVQPWGTLDDGTVVSLYTLKSPAGMEAAVTDYGGTVVSLLVPGPAGDRTDVVLGFSDLESYVRRSPYFGAIIGRYGNRIANGRFTLDGKVFTLACNNSPGGRPCHLHGGVKGFDKRVWDAEPLQEHNRAGVRLTYCSKDGEEGYPGNLRVTVTYWVYTRNSRLRIEYEAATDAATPVNLTHHSYFNLQGQGSPSILGHELRINAQAFTPVDSGLIPLGEIRPVAGTPFDFRAPHTIGERIDDPSEQLACGEGYDHNFVLDRRGPGLARAAVVRDPESGRRMEVWTTEPGLQFYSGNFLDGSLRGKGGAVYLHRSGFCLETQHFPDSPNQPGFPDTVLRPGETYRSVTEYRFGY